MQMSESTTFLTSNNEEEETTTIASPDKFIMEIMDRDLSFIEEEQ